jgi:hypothetical protein
MNVKGLDKGRILKALYNNTRLIASMAYATAQVRGDLTTDDARAIIQERGTNLYFDYLHGRMIKTDLRGDEIDFRLYDRDNFPGAGELAVLEEFTSPGKN